MGTWIKGYTEVLLKMTFKNLGQANLSINIMKTSIAYLDVSEYLGFCECTMDNGVNGFLGWSLSPYPEECPLKENKWVTSWFVFFHINFILVQNLKKSV